MICCDACRAASRERDWTHTLPGDKWKNTNVFNAVYRAERIATWRREIMGLVDDSDASTDASSSAAASFPRVSNRDKECVDDCTRDT